MSNYSISISRDIPVSVLTTGISRRAICDRALDRTRSIPVLRGGTVSFAAFEMQTSRRGVNPDYIALAESSGLSVRLARRNELSS